MKDKKLNESAFTGGITGIAISAGLYIFAVKYPPGSITRVCRNIIPRDRFL